MLIINSHLNLSELSVFLSKPHCLVDYKTVPHFEIQNFLFSYSILDSKNNKFSLSTKTAALDSTRKESTLKISTSSSTKIHEKLDYPYDLHPNFINHRD